MQTMKSSNVTKKFQMTFSVRAKQLQLKAMLDTNEKQNNIKV